MNYLNELFSLKKSAVRGVKICGSNFIQNVVAFKFKQMPKISHLRMILRSFLVYNEL